MEVGHDVLALHFQTLEYSLMSRDAKIGRDRPKGATMHLKGSRRCAKVCRRRVSMLYGDKAGEDTHMYKRRLRGA